MPDRLGDIGTRLDLLIRQGATFGPVTETLVNPDGSPVDLSGATVRGQLRRAALDAQVAATLEVAITEATQGVFQWGLTASITAGLGAGETLRDPASRYVWDLELEDASGRVIPLHYGDALVQREVTRG